MHCLHMFDRQLQSFHPFYVCTPLDHTIKSSAQKKSQKKLRKILKKVERTFLRPESMVIDRKVSLKEHKEPCNA